MPSITLNISTQGPVINFLVHVSEPRKKALLAAEREVPKPVQARGLIDTGASNTCIDPGVLKFLELSPTGSINVSTPSTGATPHQCSQYDVAIILAHAKANITMHSLPVMESHLANQGIDALIGRDVLRNCVFIYNGESGLYTLSF